MTGLKMFHVALIILIVQFLLIIHFIGAYDHILKARYDTDRNTPLYMIMVNLANLQTFFVILFLRTNEQRGGFFLHNSITKYKMWMWICIASILAWSISLLYLICKWPVGLMYIVFIFILTGILSTALVPILIWKQKNEYEKFLDKALDLNASNNEGNGITVQQAHSIFQLYSYRNCLKDQKRWKDTCYVRKGRRPDPNQVKAIHSEDFYQLSKWSHEIKRVIGSEQEKEYLQRLQAELQERLQLYDLNNEERQIFTQLAQMDDLVMPEWRNIHKRDTLLTGHRV